MRIYRTTRSCTVHITGYEAPSAAFAVTYSRRLRSCSVLGGFINPPLPSVLSPTSVQQGSLAPRALPRFVATTNLAAAVSSSADFPGLPVIRPTWLRRFSSAGRGRFLQLLGMPLSPCCPYPPRRSGKPPRSARGLSCCLRPEAEGSAFGVIFFRGHHWVH